MRHKNRDWDLPERLSWEQTQVALLMDIRGELQKLNRLLNCPNFLHIPGTLRQIRVNTTKKRRKAKP